MSTKYSLRKSGESSFIMKTATTYNTSRSSMQLLDRTSSHSSSVLTDTSNSPAPAPTSSSLIEFPTSPQPAAPYADEIIHYSHSKHPLVEISLPELFVCSGCKEYGAGRRFTCQRCDFQLHDFCALSPPVLKAHPLHGQHQLVFHARPKQAGISWPRCDICCKSTKGFTFRCRACSFHMHPCCAMLSTETTFSVHPHTLKLLPPANLSGGGDQGFTCSECKRRRSGRVYRCTVCDYYLHAVCAKAMINGLHTNGIKTPEKPSMLGSAARLASQVVIEFIGGLIEGFGEGVGESLIQNIVRGRSQTRARRQSN